MTNDQANNLHAIAKALHVIADGSNQDAAMAQQATVLGTGRRHDTPEQRRETEIERELQRISRANDVLGGVIEQLWSKLVTVTSPPPPAAEESCNTALENCGSQVGTSLQNQALRIEGMGGNLRYLIDSLAV